jgi:hypothetical protein
MGAGDTLRRWSRVRLLFKGFYVPFMFIVIWELAIRARFLLKTSMCMRCLVWSWSVAMISLASVSAGMMSLKLVQSEGGVVRYSPYEETNNGAVRNAGQYGWLTIYGTLLLIMESAFICISFYWVGGSLVGHRMRSWMGLIFASCLLTAARVSNAFGYARWGFIAGGFAELFLVMMVLRLQSAIQQEAAVKEEQRQRKLAFGDRSGDANSSDEENAPLL